jgi:putative aldouronate transport system permease protein
MGKKIRLDLRRNYQAYLMALPAIVLLFIFAYVPMYGIVIAFTDYKPVLGVFGSKWIGLEHFRNFFSSVFAYRIIRNTLLISAYSFAFGFPLPILLALLLNEVKCRPFKRAVQTISYMPYFISAVVACGILKEFLSYGGLVGKLAGTLFGAAPQSYLSNPAYFRAILIASDIWQAIGWNSIIYLAALASVDVELYNAAKIDGAGRLRQIWHVTLPGIQPTIIVLMILSVGSLLSVEADKILLLYSPSTYETADVIGTYVYRRGLVGSEYGFSTAIGLMNTLVNLMLLMSANWLSRRATGESLW